MRDIHVPPAISKGRVSISRVDCPCQCFDEPALSALRLEKTRSSKILKFFMGLRSCLGSIGASQNETAAPLKRRLVINALPTSLLALAFVSGHVKGVAMRFLLDVASGFSQLSRHEVAGSRIQQIDIE